MSSIGWREACVRGEVDAQAYLTMGNIPPQVEEAETSRKPPDCTIRPFVNFTKQVN